MTAFISISIFIFLSLIGFLIAYIATNAPAGINSPWNHVYTAEELSDIATRSQCNLEKLKVVQKDITESVERMRAASALLNKKTTVEKMKLILEDGEYLRQQSRLCIEHWKVMNLFVQEGLKVANINYSEMNSAVASTSENLRRRYRKLYKATDQLAQSIRYYRDQSKYLYELYENIVK